MFNLNPKRMGIARLAAAGAFSMILASAPLASGCTRSAKTEDRATKTAPVARDANIARASNTRPAEPSKKDGAEDTDSLNASPPPAFEKKNRATNPAVAPPKSSAIALKELDLVKARDPRIDEIDVRVDRSLALATIALSKEIEGSEAADLAREVGAKAMAQEFTALIVQVVNEDTNELVARAEFRPDHTLEISIKGQEGREGRW